MPQLELKSTSKLVQDYYSSLKQYSLLHATHEGAVSAAFGTLLEGCAHKLHWKLVNQYELRRKHKLLRVDGAIVDPWRLAHGYWEAKDEEDDLLIEAKKKIDVGYPTDNILFQAPDRAILYQDGRRVLDEKLAEPKVLVDVVKEFFHYEPPHYQEWEQAVRDFKDRVPDLARALKELIAKELTYVHFREAFNRFAQVCRTSLNPQLTDEAVEKMLVQHILTERIFRKVFNNPDFVRRNAIAVEIEQVIDKLVARSFLRDQFLGGLDRFYSAIERTAGNIEEFSEKQSFLNAVYENFFQGFDEKTADTHGIVYTPQPIVRFMVKSVDEILRREFGKSLGDKGVHILDPFVGTGNFVLNIMREIPRTRLPYKYSHELHANEVMLLPYYIASMNLEHEYAELTNEYVPFEGLCLVDTFELAESNQGMLAGMAEKNTERVEAQRHAPITVIIGNPPYNAWQIHENDGNRNRKYKGVDDRVAKTYAAASRATLVSSLSDPYVKAFRWASDRLGDEGVLAYVSNGSYVSKIAFDGMRHHLAKDFDEIYVIDLGGDIRENPRLSGTTHNVFGIQVSVAIGLFIRRKGGKKGERNATIFYACTGEDWRKEQKYKFLDENGTLGKLDWRRIEPDERDTWLTEGLQADFEGLMPLVGEAQPGKEPKAIFGTMSNGLKSNNDAYVFGFQKDAVALRAQTMVNAYNAELTRWKAQKSGEAVEEFIRIDESTLKWIRKTKRYLERGTRALYHSENVVEALYRPFVKMYLFFDRMFLEDVYSLPEIFHVAEAKQRALVVSGVGMRSPFAAFMTGTVPEQHLCASSDAFQVFPLLRFVDNEPRDNITDWALTRFREHYKDSSITKWAIFHYVYALLHHSEYRTRYEANLKRELPRVPFEIDFWVFSKAGEQLAELHLGYETQPEYPLVRVEKQGIPLDWRVEKMKLSRDKSQLVYNEFLTLAGIPTEALEYRLGNRSALEWVIDQLQVKADRRSGIVNDPNRSDDKEFILRLIGQVITVSTETIKIVRALPPLGGRRPKEALAALEGAMTPVASQISELKALGTGWHDEDTPALDPKGLDAFHAFLEAVLKATDLPTPYLYPTPVGGVRAEWSLTRWELSAEVELVSGCVHLHATAVHGAGYAEHDFSLGSQSAEKEFASFYKKLVIAVEGP